MNLKNTASKSWKDFQANKSITLVLLVATIISALAFTGMSQIGGLWDVINTQQVMESKYTQISIEQNLTATQLQDLDSYKQEKQIIEQMWLAWLTPSNIALTALVLIITIIFSVYTTCLVFLMCAKQVKNKDGSISKNYIEAKSYFWRSIGATILMVLIFIVAALVFLIGAAIISAILSFISKSLSVAFFILAMIGLLTLTIYIYARLFFPYALLFLENSGAAESISKSANLTKGRVNEILPAIAYIIVISIPAMLLGTINESATVNTFAPLSLLYYAAYYIVSSITSAYLYIFMMNAYLDFTSGKKDVTGTEVADEFMKTKQKKPAAKKAKRK